MQIMNKYRVSNNLSVMYRPELGKSLNTDEAIALGAVYQGAGHTKLFRVKKFIVKDSATYPIQVQECTLCTYICSTYIVSCTSCSFFNHEVVSEEQYQ